MIQKGAERLSSTSAKILADQVAPHNGVQVGISPRGFAHLQSQTGGPSGQKTQCSFLPDLKPQSTSLAKFWDSSTDLPRQES